jgi:RNA polymerase sigma factor (sigma-70 family)
MSNSAKKETASAPQKIRSDDLADIDAMVRRYRNALLRFFQRHLGNPEDAEDLAQEVFVRFVQITPPPAIANFEAYLFRIATNLLRDRFRRNRTHHVLQHLPIDECISELPGEAPSVERVYEEQERLRAFLQALEELSPKCRTVFLLQRYKGMSYSAVAQQLGIGVSAVEKHMMKALLHFSTRLDLT